ncbi:MAG TPA: carboxypeptidase-like regulatory domain-containing protein [Acidobacteriota bacterium]|nr:carboxypeptidase-like regulatory domain-containing protein [Acidobacteriota bacterium]
MKALTRMLIVFGLSMIPLTVTAAAAEDKGRITGIITTVSGSPVHDAIVKIFRDKQEDVFSVIRSDAHGFFRSLRLVPGVYSLQISHGNYQPVSSRQFAVDNTRTISFNIALQEIAGYISRNDDPRNWDVEDVMRSTSDRRMIFRNAAEDESAVAGRANVNFTRSGALTIASTAPLGGEVYLPLPPADSGISSSFALSERLSDNSRIIFSGQLDVNSGSFWRIRNTYNYRHDENTDLKASVGIGRMTGSYPAYGYMPCPSTTAESEIAMYAFSLELTNRLLDILAVRYGIDYSRFHYGRDRSFLYPSVQVIVSPFAGWNFNAAVSSNRISNNDMLIFPDGETINMSEPTLIAMAGNEVRMSQVRHTEVSVERLLQPGTTIEVAMYQDQTMGSGIPMMVTSITPIEQKSYVIDIKRDRSIQQGLRMRLNHRISDLLNGSIGYIYGEARSIAIGDELISSVNLEHDPERYLKQQFEHSITGRLTAIIPITQTTVMTSMRWNSGNPLTALDWFSNRMDLGAKSVNLVIRQGVPFPEVFGNDGRWEFMVDLRNVLNQGREILPTTDGELVLNQNPRSIRVGINISFR